MVDESKVRKIVEEAEIDVPISVLLKDIGERTYSDFSQLAYLGKVADVYEIFGHKFKAHSLNAEEEIQLTSVLLPNLSDPITYMKALWVESLSRCLEEVDGKPLAPQPLKPEDKDEWIENKRKVILDWSPQVVASLYEEIYLDLKKREAAVVEVIKKLYAVEKNGLASSLRNEGVSSRASQTVLER